MSRSVCWPNARSYTQGLRIIVLPRQPGTMPVVHTDVRGRCHGGAPVVLPVRPDRPRVAALPAAFCLAERARPTPASSCPHHATPPAFQRPQTVCRPASETTLGPVCPRSPASHGTPAGATRPHAPDAPTPPHGISLQALLSPYGLALSRLARAGQPACQRPSQWRSRKTRPRHRVPRRLSRASWHALSWPAGGSGADCARAGGPGRRTEPAGPRAGL